MKKSGWVILGVAVALGAGLALLANALDKRRNASQPPSPASAAGPQRIICMAPNIAETVFLLGAGDRVVGVSEYTVYPEAAAKKPSVGAVYNPNLELITALSPDLVIVQEKHEQVEALCRARGIEVLRVTMTRVAGIRDGVRALGDKLGCAGQAKALCDEMDRELGSVMARVAGKPRVKTFVCVDRPAGALKSVFTIGKTSFLSEVIDIAGGENIFNDTESPYPEASLEALLARAPEVIIETRPGQKVSEELRQSLVKDWAALPGIPAVRDGRVFIVTDDFIVVPGPRVGLIARRLAELLHPEE